MIVDSDTQIVRVEVTPDISRAIEPHLLEALFEHAAAQPAHHQAHHLTVTQAVEVLAARQPLWRDKLTRELVPSGQLESESPRATGIKLHHLLKEAHLYFRREGARAFREATRLPTTEERSAALWKAVFEQRVAPWFAEQGMLESPDGLEAADALVECLKAWVRDLTLLLESQNPTPEPSDFFLDVESDVTATFKKAGRTLIIRGRPDALLLKPEGPGVELLEYKFASPDLVELRLAQVVLYMALIREAKGVACTRGCLLYLRAAPPPSPSGTAFPVEVEKAFHGYIGNAAAVRRLKIAASLARRHTPPKMGDNYLFTGPGGLGKTELARRVADALGTPFVDLPAGVVRTVDDLVSTVDKALHDKDLAPEETGKSSGRPVFKYPPLVIFLDEVHELRRRADQFLNLFEPKERRAVAKDKIADFKDATVLAATTDLAKLPAPFLTRFRRVDLESYRPEEVARMVAPVFASAGLQVAPEVTTLMAHMGRCNPRRTIELAKEFRDQHTFDPSGVPLTESALNRLAQELWRVDELGLLLNDYLYLTALETGPKGLATLKQMLPVGEEEITSMIEPYLLQLDAISLGSSGRRLTVRGSQILSERSDKEHL